MRSEGGGVNALRALVPAHDVAHKVLSGLSDGHVRAGLHLPQTYAAHKKNKTRNKRAHRRLEYAGAAIQLVREQGTVSHPHAPVTVVPPSLEHDPWIGAFYVNLADTALPGGLMGNTISPPGTASSCLHSSS